MNDKEIFSQYIEMINRFEYVSNKGNAIYPTELDKKIMKVVKALTANNDKYKTVLKNLHSLPPKERHSYLNEAFDRKTIDTMLENPKIEEQKENKALQFIKKNKEGFVDNALYLSIISAGVLFVAIIVALFYYYIS